MASRFIFVVAVAVDFAHALSTAGAATVRPRLHSGRAAALNAVMVAPSSASFPDERTRRVALEAAFSQIDKDGSEALDLEELSDAGFDAEYVLRELDANGDGQLTRAEVRSESPTPGNRSAPELHHLPLHLACAVCRPARRNVLERGPALRLGTRRSQAAAAAGRNRSRHRPG